MDSGALIENWTNICNKVKTYEGIDASQINAFFSRLEPQAMSEGFLMLTADNEFIKTWIERHYVEVIKRALEDTYGMPFMVIIEVDNTPRIQQPVAQATPAPQGGTAYQAQPMMQSAPAAQPMSQPQPTQPQAQYPVAQNWGAHQDAAVANSGFEPPVQSPFQQEPAQAAPFGQGSNAQTSAPFGAPQAQDAYAQSTLQQPQGWSQHEDFAQAAQQHAATPLPFASEENSIAHGGREHPYSMSDPSFDHYIDRSAQSEKPAAGARPADAGATANAGGRPTSTLTFENFVIGDSNRMAYSMAVDVAEMPGKTPLNPLFIYGKSGLGKTHLMRAIQNYICETQPHLRTVYVDSAELLSDYMEASAAHDKEKSSYKNFKTHYEEADVLLIDDIQYLQGKKQTLDIVFQIFNKLTSQGRQIVLSADRAPKNIDIDERYHSRFNQGGTIDIQPPEIETKLGIVKSFINEYRNTEGGEHFTIPEDIQMYIAENSSSNIRELKSAVTKVIYQMTFFNQPDLTVSDVRSLLENHFSGGTSKNLTVEDIQKEVESFFKVKHSDLIGPKRARNIVYPRQIAIYLCRQLLDLPFNDIGKKFNRDHSTAMHSVATVEEMMRNSREVQEEIETLKQIIREL